MITHNAFDSLPPLRDVIETHGLNPKKSLGQNFILDQNVTDKIVSLALSDYAGNLSDLTVFEIGPGPGGLTRSILKTGVKKVIAIELDQRAIKALQGLKCAADGRLEIIESDALKIDLTNLCTEPRAIIANLPYNIATPLLTDWLKDLHKNNNAYDVMALMFQREVANRITANVKDKPYGRLSILSNWICRTARIYDLPPNVFTPPPKVNSAVVKFIPKKLDDDRPTFEAVEKLTAAAFGQRRKMLRSSLKSHLGALSQLGMDPAQRAEELSTEDYISIAKFLSK